MNSWRRERDRERMKKIRQGKGEAGRERERIKKREKG